MFHSLRPLLLRLVLAVSTVRLSSVCSGALWNPEMAESRLFESGVQFLTDRKLFTRVHKKFSEKKRSEVQLGI